MTCLSKRNLPCIRRAIWATLAVALLSAAWPIVAAADPTEFFSTGSPDGLIGTLSRPDLAGSIETESADDFLLAGDTQLTGATFTGLVPIGATVGTVRVEIYRVFPLDSTVPPSVNVPTRANSPSDVVFVDRGTDTGDLTLNFNVLNPDFTVANTVVNGINKSPSQFTGGEGPASGQEVKFSVTFTTPITLPTDHYFFIPQVRLNGGDFLWLSAPKPIVAPGTPFTPDLQSWIRNANLDPDWLRVGTDITHQGPFNASFSLIGQAVPEPSTLVLAAVGLLALLIYRRRRL